MLLTTEKPRKLEINQSIDYEKLTLYQKLTLNAWIVNHIKPHKVKSFGSISSYRLKHYFEYSHRGFYITNGQMKGAMLYAGFTPKDKYAVNWTFTLSRKLLQLDFAN